MGISTATIGQQAVADAYFYQANSNNPLAVTAPVSYVVRNQNNLLIVQGSCTQDANNAAHWLAQFTLPATVTPTGSNQYFTINFTANSSNGSGVGLNAVTNTQSQQFSFTVVSSINSDTTDTAIVVLQSQPFTVNLVLPYPTLQLLALEFYSVHGGQVASVDTSSVNLMNPTQTNQGYVYPIPVPYYISQQLLGTQFGVFPYFAFCTYMTPSGDQNTTVYTTYIVNSQAMSLMNDIQRYSDRIRNKDIIPQLRITQLDLMHFAMKGIDMLSAEPPSNFTFNFCSLPNQFYHYAQTAGCIKLLEAQYLGYGMSTFNFGGAAVQLDYDPTSYIMQIIEQLRQDFSKAGLAKNHWARSGGGRGAIATIGGSFGPVSNLVFRVTPYNQPTGTVVLPYLG